jgi:hypothetical protein
MVRVKKTCQIKFMKPDFDSISMILQTQKGSIAFSSEVDTGSREENASNQNDRAPLLITSEAERL